jgi:hypothetical protein
MGGWYPENPGLGQVLQTHVTGFTVDKGFLAHISIPAADAVAADADGILASFATSATVATVKTSGFTQPAIPRNVTIEALATGTAADVKAVAPIVEGHDMEGNVITETLPAFTVNVQGTVAGTKAFADITKVTIPAMDGADVPCAVGFGDVLGLPYKLPTNTVLFAALGGAREGTAPTVATSATVLSANTIDLHSALNGSQVDIYLVA